MSEKDSFHTTIYEDMVWLIDNAGDATTGDDYGREWRRVAHDVRTTCVEMTDDV